MNSIIYFNCNTLSLFLFLFIDVLFVLYSSYSSPFIRIRLFVYSWYSSFLWDNSCVFIYLSLSSNVRFDGRRDSNSGRDVSIVECAVDGTMWHILENNRLNTRVPVVSAILLSNCVKRFDSFLCCFRFDSFFCKTHDNIGTIRYNTLSILINSSPSSACTLVQLYQHVVRLG